MSNPTNVEISNGKIRMTQEFVMTVEQLNELLVQYKYDGQGLERDTEVENTKLPPIAIVFYKWLFETEKIPKPDTLFEEYLGRYFGWLPDGKICAEIEGRERVLSMSGVKARLMRTYPSLVRDLHFLLLVREDNRFEGVYYSFEDDYYNGIDLKVKYMVKLHSVALMVSTRRSDFFLAKKFFRREPAASKIEVHLDMKNSAVKIGDYYLYTKKHLDLLITEIETKMKIRND